MSKSCSGFIHGFGASFSVGVADFFTLFLKSARQIIIHFGSRMPLNILFAWMSVHRNCSVQPDLVILVSVVH